jgi:copper chaperone
MSTVTYSVPKISCGHCVHTIQSEVSNLAGVKKVEADLATKQVTVQYDPPASDESLRALLAEINYPVAS